MKPSGLPPAKAGTFGNRLGPHALLLASSDGKLPAITLSTGHTQTIWGGAHWRLSDAAGTEVASGSVPPDKNDHTIDFPVPQDGVYRLDYEDGGAGTRWSWPEGAAVVAVADRQQPIYGIGQREVYFFVPQGTQRIVAWMSSMSSVIFRDPSGQTVKVELDSWPNMLVVEVAEGLDGKAWSVSSSVNGQFALLNVPPYLARSPDELLVPTANPVLKK